MMTRNFGLASIKDLEKVRSLNGSSSASASTKLLSSSLFASSDASSSGSFANLKYTAEKLVREQASAKADLDIAKSKVKRLTEQIHILEEKLQGAFNENSKLKVKQNEDEKLWKGLESKFSSTKKLCDQLIETLNQLNIQVQQAEKDKAFLEDKLHSRSEVLDELQEHIKSLSSRLESSENTIKTRDKELVELGLANEKAVAYFNDEQIKAVSLIEEKDSIIKRLEEDAVENKMVMDDLLSQLAKLHLDIKVKQDDLLSLNVLKEKLERENKELLASQGDLTYRNETALKDVKNLECFVEQLVKQLIELENQSLEFSEKMKQMISFYDSCLELAQNEKDLVTTCAGQKFELLENDCARLISENKSMQLINHELNSRVLDLQKEQEFSMVQHAEECRLADEKIRKLESDAEFLVSKKTGMQDLIVNLEDNLRIASENSALSDKKMQDLVLKNSELERESKDLSDVLRTDIMKKQGEIDQLLNEGQKSAEKIESLEKKVNDTESALQEGKLIIVELTNREKQFVDQRAEILASLADAESKLEESKKQYDHMVEIKHQELSKHLKEISLRNDQAINDIRRKYEVEKQEAVIHEKQKADKVIQDMEKRCDEKIAESKKEFQKLLQQMQEENAALISSIRQEYSNKELILMSKHTEELKHREVQSETELREKIKSLRSEHDAQLRALRCEHEDECRRLLEELDMQSAREERQRALLQLQWKVMGDKPQEDQEVTSKKRRNKEVVRRRMLSDPDRSNAEEKESPYIEANMLENADNVNTGSPVNMPAHSRKVTHHEYEVETSDGRTITKRKKTKSTVMFGDPRKHRSRCTPKIRTPKEVVQSVVKGGIHPKPSNIGDLFTEGSLNPYADVDPFAFD